MNENPTPAEVVLSELPPKKNPWKDRLSTLFLFIGAFVTALLINGFVFQSYEVDGQSMEPTLQNNDRLIIYKLQRSISYITRKTYVPNRGDVVVFHKPNGSSDQLIKRVIGLPGDRVVVKNNEITIYNAENPEGFNPDDAPYGLELPETAGNVDVTVGEDEVFVCGDNRIPGASLDSRSVLGNVPAKLIVGKLVLRYLPAGNYKVF
jgi:signal peptidase I